MIYTGMLLLLVSPIKHECTHTNYWKDNLYQIAKRCFIVFCISHEVHYKLIVEKCYAQWIRMIVLQKCCCIDLFKKIACGHTNNSIGLHAHPIYIAFSQYFFYYPSMETLHNSFLPDISSKTEDRDLERQRKLWVKLTGDQM